MDLFCNMTTYSFAIRILYETPGIRIRIIMDLSSMEEFILGLSVLISHCTLQQLKYRNNQR